MLTDDECTFILWFLGLPTLYKLAIDQFLKTGDSRLFIPLQRKLIISSQGRKDVMQFLERLFRAAIGSEQSPQVRRQVLLQNPSLQVIAQAS